MKKTVALSLSFLVMMGAISGCSSLSPTIDPSSVASANANTQTIPPKVLDEATESLRVKGEVTLNNVYEKSISAEAIALQEDDKVSHPENEFIPLEAHFARNSSFIESIEKDIALSDEFSQQVSYLAKRSNVSEQTVYRYFLIKERSLFVKLVDFDRVKGIVGPDEFLGIFPGTMKNKTGEFVLSSENTYVKNMDGAITRSLRLKKGVLIDDGAQIVLHQTPDSNENKSELSYDAALYDHFKKTTVGIQILAIAVDKLNATPFSPGTRYTLVKKNGSVYIQVIDSQSILAGSGDLLLKVIFVG